MLRTAAVICLTFTITTQAEAASRRQEFPNGPAEVFAAIVAAIPATGYKIRSQDPAIRRVNASAGMSATSWGERFSLTVNETPSGTSAVEYDSSRAIATDVLDGGRGYKIFDKLMLAVSQRLTPIPAGSGRPPMVNEGRKRVAALVATGDCNAAKAAALELGDLDLAEQAMRLCTPSPGR